MLHGHDNVEMDTTMTNSLKVHTTRVSDTFRTRHVYPIYFGHDMTP